MIITNKKESPLLFLGDISFFILALWITLIVRYAEIPSKSLFYNHFIPFSFLFILWILVFFIAGLYGKHTVLFKNKLPSVILNAQITNIILAAIFFFLLPIFGIAPKTNLFIYLVISSIFILLWRLFIFPRLNIRKRARALLIGSGSEIKELEHEVNNNRRYGFKFSAMIDLDQLGGKELTKEVHEEVLTYNATVIVLDAKDERIVSALPSLYSLLFNGVQFIDLSRLYEDIFDRVPISFVRQNWLIDNVSFASKTIYDVLKRLFDIGISLILGAITLILYPFVFLAVKKDDGGPILYTQERVGRGGEVIHISKFRTMTRDDSEEVTSVGRFLRKTRIDELPQLLAVLKGDLSLIGPRPEIPKLVDLYEQELPYYNVRHLIKPGLSGWAQIHQEGPPKFGPQYDETKLKLAYDLYYIKNRSFLIDLKIALLTIKTLISRSGI